MKKERVIVGLSGGVDSAVSALLLLRQGYDVHGLFMKNWEEDDAEHYCAAAEDLKIVRQVCQLLDIPLHAISFATEYWDRVFTYFLAEYSAGRTPNPDVLCNKEIKFKAFLDHALRLGANRIATGHYARIVPTDRGLALLKGEDVNKDQSYFLYTLGQEQLKRALFPVGDHQKSNVRALAMEAGLPNHARKDSTGICFIGERKFKDFLARYLPLQPGEMLTPEGEIKGRHDGLMFHTIGQRQGLGIGGPGEAWYVVGKDVASNTLYVAQGETHQALFRTQLDAGDLHWVSGRAPETPVNCQAKTRYRQEDQPCVITAITDSVAHVQFAQQQRAITPGQSVVFYDGQECLGGGVIL